VAKLIYSNIASLDGYIEDEDGEFGWARPSEEVHAFENELMRPLGTHLYGRRLYETMRFWETDDPGFDESPVYRDFATIWRATDKIVYSRTLDEPSTARTQIEREFDPEAVRRLKESADRDLAIGGPGLASEAFRAGLVDEIHLVLVPVVVGGGKPALPKGVQANLELLDERRFDNGSVHLHYRVRAE
jgi:dihydrofolate reductase